MEPHEHFPDYAYYRSRQVPKQLTCIHCGKPICCTNEHLSWLGFLPAIPIVIAFICQSHIAFMICILAAMLVDEPLNRFIFLRSRFEIDNDVIRGDMTRYRHRK